VRTHGSDRMGTLCMGAVCWQVGGARCVALIAFNIPMHPHAMRACVARVPAWTHGVTLTDDDTLKNHAPTSAAWFRSPLRGAAEFDILSLSSAGQDTGTVIAVMP
jgi:hypothetical protein